MLTPLLLINCLIYIDTLSLMCFRNNFLLFLTSDLSLSFVFGWIEVGTSGAETKLEWSWTWQLLFWFDWIVVILLFVPTWHQLYLLIAVDLCAKMEISIDCLMIKIKLVLVMTAPWVILLLLLDTLALPHIFLLLNYHLQPSSQQLLNITVVLQLPQNNHISQNLFDKQAILLVLQWHDIVIFIFISLFHLELFFQVLIFYWEGFVLFFKVGYSVGILALLELFRLE